MKKQIVLISLFVSFALAGHSQWAQDSLSTGRTFSQAVTFGDKVYFIGGETGQYPQYETANVSVYDCISSAWDPSDSISLARSSSVCISGDSGIYVLGGRNLNFIRTISPVSIFDATNRIDIFKNGAWHTDSLPDHVWGGRALKVGSKLLFAGFVDSINYYSSEIFASKKVYIFDESTGLWSTDSLSSARTELGAATNGTLAIFAGGVNGMGVTSDEVDIYNATTGSWTTAQLSVSRGYVGGTYANGKFYFAGGVQSGVLNVSSDVIDIFDGSAWTTDHLSVPRAGVMAVAISNEVYFMGGGEFDLSILPILNTNGTYNTVDILNTSSGNWSRKDFNFPHLDYFGTATWHLYAGFTTWGNKIFVGGGGSMAWTHNNALTTYSRNVEIRDVTLGLSELTGEISFEVYPNPATGPVTLMLPGDPAEIRITDIIGQEVMYIKTMDRRVKLQLEKSGIYFVTVKTKKGTATRKIIVSI